MTSNYFVEEIRQFQEEAYDIASSRGWHETPRTFGEAIALCHSELSEAIQEYREYGLSERYEGKVGGRVDGVSFELADCVIRIADLCQEFGLDLGAAIYDKMEYNKTREYRHGGKII